MERTELLTLWNDMAQEGNWVPSWTESLAHLSAQEAAWSPQAGGHCIWQEVVHVTYWRRVTLQRMAGGAAPDEEEIAALEFAMPAQVSEAAWAETLTALRQTQERLAAAIVDGTYDLTRLPYHLIHDAYHLGRITHLRMMQGSQPQF